MKEWWYGRSDRHGDMVLDNEGGIHGHIVTLQRWNQFYANRNPASLPQEVIVISDTEIMDIGRDGIILWKLEGSQDE